MNFRDILIGVLSIIIILLLLKGFNSTPTTRLPTTTVNNKKYEVIKYVTDTVIKVIPQTKIIKGKDIYHEVVIEKELPRRIDTIKIIKDYNNKVVYKDTLKIPDSLGIVTLVDTVSNNRIVNRKWESYIKQKIITEKIVVKDPPKNQLYVGINVGINKTELIHNISGGLLLKTKKDRIYQLSIGLTNLNNDVPFISVGSYWKIKLKK